jgi:hypothetical protein
VENLVSRFRAEDWTRCLLRDSTRGPLQVDIAHRRVWLWDGAEAKALCWHLVVRRELGSPKTFKYSLSNAEADPVESGGRRNTELEGGAIEGKRRSDRALRAKSPLPGRPGIAQREDRRRFWALIAAGQSSWDAAIGVGVSEALGSRWFREAGGLPPSTLGRSSKPPSGQYLSFAEREEVAL